MKIDRNVVVHLKEVSQHTVIQLRCENLQKAHCADGLAHLEALAFAKVEGGRRDEIFGTQTGTSYHVEGEAERLIRVHVEHIVQHFQTLIAGKRLSLNTESFEVVENIRLNAFELGLRSTQRVSLNTEGDVLALEQAIVAFGELFVKHTGILGTDVVEVIILLRNVDLLLELIDAGSLIDEGELDKDRAIEVVEEVTPILKDGGLVLILSKLVVDVVIADGLGIEAAIHLADTVTAHLHIGDRLLRGLTDFLGFSVLFLLHDDFLLFLSGKSIAVHLAIFYSHFRLCCLFGAAVQSAIPPVL